MNAVKTALLTVTGIGDVKIDGADALQIEKFPAAVIGIGSDIVEHLLNDQINHQLTVPVSSIIASETEVLKTLLNFEALVKQKMAADPKFGLTAIDSKEVSTEPPEALNQQSTIAARTTIYEFSFRTSRTDPFTLVG